MSLTIAGATPRKKYGETSFAERLQAIRKARGLTQVQLAEAAETTQRAVSYYETETGFPPAPAVIALISSLPERDRKAVVRLINSLVAAGAPRRNGSMGERNGG